MERKVGSLASGFVNLVVSTGSTHRKGVCSTVLKRTVETRGRRKIRRLERTYLAISSINSDRSGPPGWSQPSESGSMLVARSACRLRQRVAGTPDLMCIMPDSSCASPHSSCASPGPWASQTQGVLRRVQQRWLGGWEGRALLGCSPSQHSNIQLCC